jgi:Zn-dependent protease with chaperone function
VDFFSHQAAARRQTRWLVVGFALAIGAVVIALDAVLVTLLALSHSDDYGRQSPLDYAFGNPGVLFFCTILVLAVIGCASLFKAMTLRGGGGVVARSLGGIRVERNTTDLKRKRLHNVVEEMAIASGVPMPEVYVLEQESAINAFAAGHTAANAAVAVTQGALDRLNRDQLQGVIAHEFSHVLNGDMRLNIQLMGWLFGLFVLALIGRTILRLGPSGRKSGAAIYVAALALVVLGYVGLLAGRILQAAVSRQRERLADASAVQFTRNPLGLKDALIKIAGLGEGSRIKAADAEQVAHMLFAPGLSRVFATHPPIAERIKALDPSFDPRKLSRIVAEMPQDVLDVDDLSQSQAVISRAAPVAVSPRSVASQVGNPETVHVRHARELRVSLPANLREFVETSGRARALVIGLLLSRDAAVRDEQMRIVTQSLESPDLTAVNEISETARSLSPMQRLPALMQIFPALRSSTLEERQTLSKLVDALVHADLRVDVFEYCLAKLLEMLFRDEMEARAPHGRLSLDGGQQAIHVLFAVLARAGAADETQARRAYEAGMQAVFPMRRPEYSTYEDWPQRLDAALPTLEKLQPFAKQALIEGLVRVISHDDVLNVEEAELLRTACALMHCPLPPLLPGLNKGSRLSEPETA